MAQKKLSLPFVPSEQETGRVTPRQNDGYWHSLLALVVIALLLIPCWGYAAALTDFATGADKTVITTWTPPAQNATTPAPQPEHNSQGPVKSEAPKSAQGTEIIEDKKEAPMQSPPASSNATLEEKSASGEAQASPVIAPPGAE